jgi:hypothetical protein
MTIGSAKGEHEVYPSSIESAVDSIIRSMSEEDRLTVKKTNKLDLIKFHHGFGTGIRNSLGLWRGNDKLIIEACGKPCHPDDASGVIIYAVWCKLNDTSFSRKEYIENREARFQRILDKSKTKNSNKN